jgi:transcriptional regulator with XRE-family HTH domain
MSYGQRLSEAMKNAGVTRKVLAQTLGVTVHAIGMVITGAGGRERWLARENHLKAAAFLQVDPNWLMTGGNTALHTPVAMQTNSPELSPTAMELAWLFDQIPVADRLRRVVAYNGATQQILSVLRELNDVPPTDAPKVAAAEKKRRSGRP